MSKYSGLKMAVKYSIVPCQLGFCGPTGESEQNALLKFLSDPSFAKATKGKEKIKNILRKFLGTIFYYNLIAGKNKISDPFDKKVIEAYWLGNDLLKKLNGAGHHSFHVYKIGSIAGRIKFTDNLRDLCRISWGKILQVREKTLVVRYRPIVKKDGKFQLGEKGDKENKKIIWNKDILPSVKIGDIVSIHWETAIEVLNKKQLRNLIRYTLINIK